MCKADISEANNSIHKIMTLLSSLSPLKNAMTNSEYIIRMNDCDEIYCKFCKFCKILYKPINIALSIGGIGASLFCLKVKVIPQQAEVAQGVPVRLRPRIFLTLGITSGVPRNFVRGVSTNSVEDRGQRERGSGGGSPLVRGSGGSCNLVQEISFHIVKFS